MTTQAIATIGPRDYTPEQVALIKSQVAPGATDDELQFFMSVCTRTGLDPFRREIYAIKRPTRQKDGSYVDKMVIQYGIDGLLALAERTGMYAGATAPQFCGPDAAWVDVWLSKEHPAAAKVGVYRKGMREPVWGVAVWTEYVQTTRDGKPMGGWANGPANQLEKCALAKAIRRACPNAFADLPSGPIEEVDGYDSFVDTETGEVTMRTGSDSASSIEAPKSEPVETYDDGLADSVADMVAKRGAIESPTTPVEAQDAAVAPPPVPAATDWKDEAQACWARVKKWAGEHQTDPTRLRFYLATADGVPDKVTTSVFKAWLDAVGPDFDTLYDRYVAGEDGSQQAPLMDGDA